MNILFLTQFLPYPPNSGPKIKTWHVLRYLSQYGHQTTLISFIRPEEISYIEAVKQVCSAVHTVPINRSRFSDLSYLIRSQFTGRPFLVERDDIAEIRYLIDCIISSKSIDVIHAHQLSMAQFALPYAKRDCGKPGLVFDAHNAIWTITHRMKQNAPAYLRLPLMIETKRIKRYEAEIVREFNATLAVTESDRQALIRAMENDGSVPAATITVLPIPVDTLEIQPVKRQVNPLNILTMGTFSYPPGADEIRWFVEEIFPLIRSKLPNVKLTILGTDPPQDLLELSKGPRSGIVVPGFVPELEPYYAESALVVIPGRVAGGTHIQILEAFARAMPVVTTTVGLEGIQAIPGKDVMVADNAPDFAKAVILLIKDTELQTQLSKNGRCLAEARYDWHVILKDLDRVYQQFV
jgi:glycosyltransferase involved in cell wall biosynthesis